MFVLKSSKQVSFEEIVNLLDSEKIVKTVQKFTDIYFHLPGLPNNGNGTESNWIRVRNCEGRFALLIREPIREGDFIIQPRVDFDISVRTVAGLLTLGYQAVAYIEAIATIYQDEKLLIEVDQLHNIPTPYIQIKGSNKESVAAAGSTLNLDGSYTTLPYIEIILEMGQTSKGVEDPQAARLQELVDYVQAQGGSAGSDVLEGHSVSVECILEDLDMRIRRLEKWNMVHTVLWTFFMSAFVGCLLYQRTQRSRS
jgi:adenylate cyclase class IV